MIVLRILEKILFFCFAVNVLYLFIFSLGSLRKKVSKMKNTLLLRRIAILIPAYKEDEVIMECIESCMQQDYPKEKYDIVVISDRMKPETNDKLSILPILLEIVHFENSTKAKALNLAMSHLSGYDIALILDADNTIEPAYLRQINNAIYSDQLIAYQTHRVAKNKNTHMAYLDAVSEEINNSIFRQGHVNLGFSAALIGSGMAFDYELLKKELAEINAIGGFDRALELTLFKKGKCIGYLPDVYVLDEKIQNQKDFTNQRRRWLSAQTHYLMMFIGDIPHALINRNWDFCDKMFQQMSIPRLLLLGGIFISASIISCLSWLIALKWWLLLCVLSITLAIAIPRKLYTAQLFIAIVKLPEVFFCMFLNLFKLRGANKKFIHTAHGTNT